MIGDLLGHADIETTARYAHLTRGTYTKLRKGSPSPLRRTFYDYIDTLDACPFRG